MILTGRPVSGEEALRMGLANRLVPKGTALPAAVKLAKEIAAFPQRCMRADRMSSYVQWNLDLPAALLNETRTGFEVVQQGDMLEGVKRFAAGAGRHGKFESGGS
jgi:enoyl-CoA hydratase